MQQGVDPNLALAVAQAEGNQYDSSGNLA